MKNKLFLAIATVAVAALMASAQKFPRKLLTLQKLLSKQQKQPRLMFTFRLNSLL
ncbi:MAG: hypothetical protein IPI37_08125 [Bacteroidales bacterium]|nr:hypothetical protein [Bacteroidales bacterium]